jgi:hypothetical protein
MNCLLTRCYLYQRKLKKRWGRGGVLRELERVEKYYQKMF